MKLNLHAHLRRMTLLSLMLLVVSASSTLAQTTGFTYQGRLTDAGGPANGAYDLQFKLYDALAGPTQVGATATLDDVAVSNGSFSVTLDFGAAAFPGTNRWLEIGVRPGVSTGAFTTLTPRQPITSTPYAINAAQLGGLAASGFLQNSSSQQGSANFNISGDGTTGGTLSANAVNATSQYNIGG
ncbi:MAG TPA: hypothetical protein VNS63_03350, partial [Blastocatellia bacterium]|nr:hypothetical protein [Blastocatellia bacterium]